MKIFFILMIVTIILIIAIINASKTTEDEFVTGIRERLKEDIKPTPCPMEYVEKYCDECEFKSYNMVSHPGGNSTSLVEEYYCEKGFWEDDF